MLTFAIALGTAEVALVSTMFPVMQAGLGLAAGDLGVLIAVGKLTAAATSPLLVWLAGRWSRKVVLVAAACLAGTVTIAIGLVGGFTALLVLSCALATISGGLVPVATAILADLFPDAQRGRAVGLMYASISLTVAVLATLLSQLSSTAQGWRVSYWVLGGLGIATGLSNLIWFEDPGMGATAVTSMPIGAPTSTDVAPRWSGSSGKSTKGIAVGARNSGRAKPSLAERLRIFQTPTFNVMMLSRLLSGHLVIGSFGILFLAEDRHFSVSTAGLVLLPFGVGSCVGNIGGAFVADWMHARDARAGRVRFLQGAQFGFAIIAGLATQIAWRDIETYMVFWLFLGLLQGVNPGVNRPIIMSVVRPELRPWAFLVMLSIVEPIGWAGYGLALSHFAGGAQLRAAFLVTLVGAMTLNGLALTALYRTYPRDVAYAQGVGPRRVGRR